MSSSASPTADAILGSRWRRFLTAALAVTAVIVGLFTMHSMAGVAAHDAANASVVTQTGDPHSHPGEAPSVGGLAGNVHTDDALLALACDQACQTACMIVSLVCTLGLLAVLVVYFLPHLAAARALLRVVEHQIVGVLVGALATPRPPSLIALSVSRT